MGPPVPATGLQALILCGWCTALRYILAVANNSTYNRARCIPQHFHFNPGGEPQGFDSDSQPATDLLSYRMVQENGNHFYHIGFTPNRRSSPRGRALPKSASH